MRSQLCWFICKEITEKVFQMRDKDNICVLLIVASSRKQTDKYGDKKGFNYGLRTSFVDDQISAAGIPSGVCSGNQA
jgi:hypothetical protein